MYEFNKSNEIEVLYSLDADQIYAVVDIEATGGSVGADERIIQLACVLIQNGQTVHTFDTFVNPSKRIPRAIQKLTGITNNDVKNAPYFEEVAPLILNLLKDTVFVAHNVGFDYRFLNEQLKGHGFKQLVIPAIDTVELTQILYPTLDSFQLEDIAAHLHYDLADAHDALADTEATAHIFKRLFNRAASLPLVTLEKLNELAACTTHETALFFVLALSRARNELEPLAEDLVVVNNIAIKKPIHTTKAMKTYDRDRIYPDTKEKKEEYLKENHTYRTVQATMMDLIYEYFNAELSLEKLAIEAPPGIGKSLGYLLPASFQATEEEPVVISTYTTLLQNQLLEETLPELEEMLNRHIPAILVKSRYHYLSLTIFDRWLRKMEANDSEAYLGMRLLVWLTETTTGDLSEINAGSHLDLDFWQEIRVTHKQYVDDAWQAFDFYERIKKSAKEAELIMTNHHFLTHDWQKKEPVIPSFTRLIVDEAHHFPEVSMQAGTQSIQGLNINKQLDKLGSLDEKTGIFQLVHKLDQADRIKSYDLLTLDRNARLLQDTWENLFEKQLDHFEKQNLSTRPDSQFVEHEFTLDIFALREKRGIKNILRALEEFIHTSQKITKQTTDVFDELESDNQLFLLELGKLTTYLSDWRRHFESIYTQNKTASGTLRWLTYLPGRMETTFEVHSLKWGEDHSFIDYLATQSKVVFTGSTLSFREDDDYFSGEMKNIPLQFHRLNSPFDYGKQVRVMVPDERVNPKDVNENEYAHILADDVAKILKDTKVNTIVLFRSLSVLEDVYYILNKEKDIKDHMLLAQSISGTRNRILKNFKRHQPAVILGADSFFEGIDLPDDALELVVLTRLPFPAPNTPMMRLKTDYLKEQGRNPFMDEYLPQAVLKFKQAFGRLIRKQSDHGVLVVLDDRFLTANYSKLFKEALPQGVPIEHYDNDQLGKAIQKFIDES